MKPYYDHAGITIYHADCREVWPTLGRFDLLLTDPPYGVSGNQKTKACNREGGQKNKYSSFVDSFEYVRDIVIPIVDKAMNCCVRAIITPGNVCFTLYPRPSSFGCIWQPCSVGLQPWGRADSQPILYYGKSPYGGKSLPSQKCSFVLYNAHPNKFNHPCPKPIKLWRQLLKSGSKRGQTVIDPFMGSGTTLVAAKEQGLKAIGIEIEEKYCEIAAQRLSQEVMALGV